MPSPHQTNMKAQQVRHPRQTPLFRRAKIPQLLQSPPTLQSRSSYSARFTDDLFASGTVQQLMESSLNQVTSFDTTYSGSYSSDDYDIRKVPISGEETPSPKPNGVGKDRARKGPRLGRSKVCHQKSSIGVVLGSIWIRTSTLKPPRDPTHRQASSRSSPPSSSTLRRGSPKSVFDTARRPTSNGLQQQGGNSTSRH